MKRIQRKRTKGYRLPSNAVYVGRPTKYGNPFTLKDYDRAVALAKYEAWLNEQLSKDPHFLDPLFGKDLACWCPLQDKNGNSVSCHADVILKILRTRENDVTVMDNRP